VTFQNKSNKNKTALEIKTRYYRWFPPEAHLGYTEEEISLNPSETALILVDIYCQGPQQNFLKGLVGDKHTQLWYSMTVNQIAPVLQAARAIKMPVIYVNNSAPKIGLEHSEFAEILKKHLGFEMTVDFREPNVDPREYHQGNPLQLQFPSVVEPQITDYFIRKQCYSGFFETRLDTLLRNLRIHNLIFVGFVADACLYNTIADALFRNYKVIFLRDCTLASELPSEVDELRQTKRIILWIETIFGVSSTSDIFINACKNLNQPAQ